MFACAKASGRGRKVHHFQQCFQFLMQREQSIILRSLSHVWICRNPPEPYLAEHRAASTDHRACHLYGWFSCSTPQPTMLWQLLPSPGAGANLIPLCHLVCSTDLYIFWKCHFKSPLFSLPYLLSTTTSYQSSQYLLLRYLAPNLFVESLSNLSLSIGYFELYTEKYLIL